MNFKLNIIVFVLVLFPIIGNSQIDDSLKRSDKVKISLVKNRALFIGVNNPVEINVNGYEAKNLIVKINNGTISHNEGNSWIAKVNYVGEGLIEVWIKEGKCEVKYGSRIFSVKKIPDPQVVLCKKQSGGFINKSIIKSSPFLYIQYEDCVIEELGYTIYSYVFSITKNGVLTQISCKSNKLTEEVIKIIESTNPDGKIVFSEIRAFEKGGGVARAFPDLVLTLK